MIGIITLFAVFFSICFMIHWYDHNEDDNLFAPKFFDIAEIVERSAVVSIILTAVLTLIKGIMLTVV